MGYRIGFLRWYNWNKQIFVISAVKKRFLENFSKISGGDAAATGENWTSGGLKFVLTIFTQT